MIQQFSCAVVSAGWSSARHGSTERPTHDPGMAGQSKQLAARPFHLCCWTTQRPTRTETGVHWRSLKATISDRTRSLNLSSLSLLVANYPAFIWRTDDCLGFSLGIVMAFWGDWSWGNCSDERRSAKLNFARNYQLLQLTNDSVTSSSSAQSKKRTISRYGIKIDNDYNDTYAQIKSSLYVQVE